MLVSLQGYGSVGPLSSSPRAGHGVRVRAAGPEVAVGRQPDAMCVSQETRTGLCGAAPTLAPTRAALSALVLFLVLLVTLL